MKVETNIKYNRNLNEYTVELLVDEEHVPDADYYTDSLIDAEVTAEDMKARYLKKHSGREVSDG